MTLTTEAYADLLKSLLPQGPAWPTDEEGSTLNLLLLAMAEELARLDARAGTLVNESDPTTTVETLEAWERNFGLPDSCAGQFETLQQRRAALLSKITRKGGQSPQYFIDLAATYGFEITIDEFFPFRFGKSAFGDAFNGGTRPFYWQINAPAEIPIPFRFGQSQFGDKFVTVENQALECLINKVKPAHTEVIYQYGP